MAQEKRDYYEVLGVSKTATDAEIKNRSGFCYSTRASAGLAGHTLLCFLSDFLEVGIHNAVITRLLLVVCTCIGAGLCTGGLLCGSGCLIHLLEHLAQGFLLCLDVVLCFLLRLHLRTAL